MRLGRRALLPAVLLAACGGGDGAAGGVDARPALDAPLADAPPPRPWADAGTLRACETQVAGPYAVIPELGAVESSVELGAAGDGRVHGITVGVDIAHSYPRDLEVSLRSPAGTTVVLARHAEGYDRVTFADGSPNAPLQPLARLDGETLAGKWTLRVVDGARGDGGALLGWSLFASGCGAPVCATSTVRSEKLGAAYHVFAVDPSFQVAAARVAISVDYAFAEDISMSLIAPGGPTVRLSDGNGGLGSDYTATIFDDTAARSITEGLAPFTGRFRPEEPLARVAGRPIAGTWEVAVTLRPSGETEPISPQSVALELDECDLPCPPGSSPSRFTPAGPMDEPDAGMPDAGRAPPPPGSRPQTTGTSLVVDVTAAGAVTAAALRASAAGSLTLRAPSGKAVALAVAAAGAFDGALFADWAARAATDGAPPWGGPRLPAEPLAALAGEPAAGQWRLEGEGELAGVTLFLCTR